MKNSLHYTQQHLYHRMQQAPTPVINLARALHNAAFSDNPEKQCRPDETPAPVYFAQAEAIKNNPDRRMTIQAILKTFEV